MGPRIHVNKRLKVVHVINSLLVGGAETLLANSLAPGGLCGFTDNVLVYLRGDSRLLGVLDPAVKTVCLDYRGGTDLPGALLRLRSLILEENPDVVHSHLTHAGLYTHLVCPKSIPHVHTLHIAYSMDTATSRVLLSLERLLHFGSRRCNVICLSEFLKDDLLQHVSFRGAAYVLNNFVADRFFSGCAREYGLDRRDLRLVAAGRLMAQKNFEYLLDVFARCVDREIYLDIYGTGDTRRFEDAVSRGNLRVRMMGECADLAPVLRGYDLFVMPSKFEGFPLSLFEAMASGLPAMVSDIAPLRSIVADNAQYLDLGDPGRTAETLVSILEKKIDINCFARKATALAGRIARRERYIEGLLSIYQRLGRS